MVSRRLRSWPVVVVACGVVLAAIGILGLQLAPHPQVAGRPAPAQIIAPEAFPSPSIVPAPSPAHSSSPAVRVLVREIGIDLPVVAGDGVNVPLYKAALYPGMAVPGAGGRSMLYAHARSGMFGPLLVRGAIGQHVDVTRADGSVLHYVVTEFYPRWPVNQLKWLQPTDHEELILLTCTTYNANDPRVVAVATPVSG